MKQADKPSIVIVIGDNNKVSLEGPRSPRPAIAIGLVLIAIAVLTVSLYCPELFADFVRWIIGKAINS